MKFGKTLVKSCLILALVFVALGCESDSDDEWDVEDVRNAIEESNRVFEEAAKNGDAAGIAARYTNNARLLPPNTPAVIGQEAVQGYFEGAVSGGNTEIDLVTNEVELQGDAAMEIGEYTIAVNGETVDNGKYVVVWFLEEDMWRMHVDIWNSNRPVE